MKTEISRDSHQPEKHYSGVYQQQGRMLTDADWNELVDILKDRLTDALTDVVGKGSPLHKNVVNNDSGSTVLHWGTVFVDGIQAEVRAAATATPGAEFDYLHQLDFPQAVGSALPVAPDDNYVYYVDVWERTVTHLMDERLRDKGLHGADTCTRKQVMAQVKWCPASIDPETANENPTKGNARLTVSLLPKTTTPDPCDPCAEQLDIDTRVGNYLFRVEIHDVIGVADNPTQIKLKWSVENAAELFALKSVLGESVEPPESFKDAPWLYEYFDEDNEKHLGIQLATGFVPERGELVSGYPLSPPERDFVRRWDGYCTLEKTAGVWTVTEQYDRNQSGPGLATFTEINTSELKISLDAQSLILTLDDSFVAGDFWIAEVREIEHDTGSLLLDQALPDGILHHYLKLGEVKASVLQDNPQADRKYAFPPLTEMTRMFIAGGDGQQAMPSHDLPHPLQVDVANGEWSVTGAQIKYQIETGGGILSKPASLATAHFELVSGNEAIVVSQQGNCSCNWQLGIAGAQRVKATLLGVDGIALDHPPVYFNANLSTANQLAYTPSCQGSGVTVHSLLDADNVQVDWPDLDEHGHTTVKKVLDTLLCKLDASKTPYDASQKTDCWQDILSGVAADQPDTIQKAIDALVCRSTSNCCNISISPGDNIQAKLAIIKNGQDADICFNKGEYQVVQSILLTNKGHITVTGRGNSTRILASNSESVFILSDCKSVAVRDITMQSGKEGKTGSNKNLNGTLDINNVNSVTVDHVNLTCPTANGERSASCLTVSYANPPDKKASVRVCHSKLNPGHHQVGLLLVNGVRVQIEDNEIRVRQKSKNWVLKDRLKVDRFRHTFRSILISNISLAQNAEVSGKKRNASITHEGTTVHFATDPELVSQWKEYVTKNPPVSGIDKQGLINYLKDVADRVLLRKIKNAPQFDSWYMRMESSLPAIASQGIVCAGRAVTDLRIMNNSVYGTAQGIHVGLSYHDPNHPYTAYLAKRVQIKGNHIVVSLSSENIAERHGIFVGNCDSLDIESNYVKVERYPENNKRKIEGIRVYGQLGKMILLRNNHMIGFTTGVFARVTNTNIHHLWKVSSNMLEGAFIRVDVAPEEQFILEHNS